MAAARNGHTSVCTLLIERGAHVDCQDNVSMHGKTNRWVTDCGLCTMSGSKTRIHSDDYANESSQLSLLCPDSFFRISCLVKRGGGGGAYTTSCGLCTSGAHSSIEHNDQCKMLGIQVCVIHCGLKLHSFIFISAVEHRIQ